MLRVLKEAEKRDKLQNAKREKEAKQQLYLEEKKRRQEERQEEKLKKLQELELKRQQTAMIKEQVILSLPRFWKYIILPSYKKCKNILYDSCQWRFLPSVEKCTTMQLW